MRPDNPRQRLPVDPYHPLALRRRGRGAILFLALALGALAAAFFRVQVVGSSEWTLRSRTNRLRQQAIPAPRGTVYDRQGRVVAEDVPGYHVTLLPGPVDSLRATVEELARRAGLSPARGDALLRRLAPTGREVTLLENADLPTVSAIEERAFRLPYVEVGMHPRRRYTAGRAMAHVLGYVGRIGPAEVGSDAFPTNRYGRNAVVGRSGIEREYESRLQGREGLRYLEVDARGRTVGPLPSSAGVAPRPGRDLHLNLDLELQRWIHRIFPDTLAGAVVALDPTDGGVLALYSAPSFDPNAFVGGISTELWDSLRTDPRKPMFNRATLGLYAPASIWKTAVAAIGLELGVVTPEEHMPEPCRGVFYYGGRAWRCWKPEGHGFNDLAEAIGNSCDVYFYQLGLRIGLERLLSHATDLGFAAATGVDLPRERAGIFPSGRDYWARHFGYSARESEVLSLAIGQGPNAQTPLRMAQFYAALARRGSAPPPTIARGMELGPGWSLDLPPEHIRALKEGLRRVTAPGGTAHLDATLELWDLVGKTGTGQNPASLAGHGENDAWFAAIAGPFEGGPEIVVVALVEQGGSGSRTAAPLAAKTADFYLRRKHGIPVDTVQTLREWVAVRGWPAWHAERFRKAWAAGEEGAGRSPDGGSRGT